MNNIEEMVRDALHEAGRGLPGETTMRLSASRRNRSLVVSVVAAVAVVAAVVPVALFSSPSNSGSPLSPPLSSPETTVPSPSTSRPSPDEQPSRAEMLAAMQAAAQSLDLKDPPTDVEFERYITPEEYGEVMVECLSDQGIPVRHSGDGGVLFGDIPPDQALMQREAVYRCQVRFPTDPMYEKPLTSEQLRILYDYFVGELTECLGAEGYETWPAPSLSMFMAAYSTHPWSPYPMHDPRLRHEAEWYRLSSACPQIPPLSVLYGD